jgi:hypothetical protein
LVEELEQAITCLRSPGPGRQFPAIVADLLEARAAQMRQLDPAVFPMPNGLFIQPWERDGWERLYAILEGAVP